jgi:hypothetical protein
MINNEAVPLGFGMTPTESAQIYETFTQQLWKLLGNDGIRLPVDP